MNKVLTLKEISKRGRKYINRRIDYVQTALKLDAINNPNRSMKDFTEVVFLIGDQFDSKSTFTVKEKA